MDSVSLSCCSPFSRPATPVLMVPVSLLLPPAPSSFPSPQSGTECYFTYRFYRSLDCVEPFRAVSCPPSAPLAAFWRLHCVLCASFPDGRSGGVACSRAPRSVTAQLGRFPPAPLRLREVAAGGLAVCASGLSYAARCHTHLSFPGTCGVVSRPQEPPSTTPRVPSSVLSAGPRRQAYRPRDRRASAFRHHRGSGPGLRSLWPVHGDPGCRTGPRLQPRPSYRNGAPRADSGSVPQSRVHSRGHVESPAVPNSRGRGRGPTAKLGRGGTGLGQGAPATAPRASGWAVLCGRDVPAGGAPGRAHTANAYAQASF